MSRIIFLVVLCFGVGLNFHTTVAAEVADVIIQAPRIKLPAQESPVQIQELSLKASITGLHAETTTTMQFYNPNNRILTGELEFPLPQGSTVTGYALDVQGRMVDGVIVSKQKARVVLETEMRRRVDPGIVEHVRGNSFRTRIYPIPARGSRTVSITYVAPLTFSGNDAAYHIPLPKGVRLAKLNLQIEIIKGPITPQLGGFGDLTLTDWSDRWVAKATLTDVTPGDDLYVRLPHMPNQLVTMEKFGGETFVAIHDVPKSTVAPKITSLSHIAIAWDASGSRTSPAVLKDIQFLTTLFQIWKNCKVDLVVFRNKPEKQITFTIKNGNSDALIDHLKDLPVDGGTDLAPLHLGKRHTTNQNAQAWLLFTDGLYTLGNAMPTLGSIPVHVITSDTQRDAAMQGFIAAASGGIVIDLATLLPADAAKKLASPPLTLMRIEDSTKALQNVHYQMPLGTGRASVYAKVREDTTVTLVYGTQGQEITRTQLNLTREKATNGRLIARAWATQEVAALSVFPDKNAAKILALGQTYSLVTPGSSLIVLETLQQYLAHKITPPLSWKSLYDQYHAATQKKEKNLQIQTKNKIETVLALWQKRIAWWEQKFSYSASDFVKPLANGTEMRYGDRGFDDYAGREPASPSSEDEEQRPGVLARMAGSISNALSQPLLRMGFDTPSAERRVAPHNHHRIDQAESRMVLSGEAERAQHERTVSTSALNSEKSSGESDLDRMTNATIVVTAWHPNKPYLQEIRKQPVNKAYELYLQQRSNYANNPGFFLDNAGYLLENDQQHLGIRVLSNLAELNIDNAHLLRVFAWRLQDAGGLDRAIEILQKVSALRPDEPQSHRDLALLLADRMERDKTVETDGLRAAKLFYKVILQQWPRFAEVEVVTLMELNRLLALMLRLEPRIEEHLSFIDHRLRRLLDADVRIVMSWDADNTDIDLHVTEPSSETANYQHNRTKIGGLVSRDFTVGYGPEEYVLRSAMPGDYRIRCKYYGSIQQSLIGPATVTATVITNFARPNEKRQRLTLRLENVRDFVDIGKITIVSKQASTIVNPKIEHSSITSLSRGMSQSAVEKMLGQPARVEHSGITIRVYVLKGNRVVRLGFGPGLLWAKEIYAGAERIIQLK